MPRVIMLSTARCVGVLLVFLQDAQCIKRFAAVAGQLDEMRKVRIGAPYTFDDSQRDAEVLALLASRRERTMRFAAAGCPVSSPHFFSDDDRDLFTSRSAFEEARNHAAFLASYPGSGNTWMRFILEGTLNIYSGSVFNDSSLRRSGLLGEGIYDSRLVMPIKTHWPVLGGHVCCTKNLYVMREPLHATLSWTSFQLASSHGEEVPRDVLSAAYDAQVEAKLGNWSYMGNFLRNFSGDLRVIRFEDMISDVRGTYLQRVLPYFDVDVRNPKVAKRLDCAIDAANARTNLNHRHHSYTFLFTDKHRELARQYIGDDLMAFYGYSLV